MTNKHQTLIDDNATQPCIEIRILPERAQMRDRGLERVLGDLLSVFVTAEDAQRKAVCVMPVAAHELIDGGRIALLSERHEMRRCIGRCLGLKDCWSLHLQVTFARLLPKANDCWAHVPLGNHTLTSVSSDRTALFGVRCAALFVNCRRQLLSHRLPTSTLVRVASGEPRAGSMIG